MKNKNKNCAAVPVIENMHCHFQFYYSEMESQDEYRTGRRYAGRTNFAAISLEIGQKKAAA